jgi:hypothetical protein
MLPLYRMLNEQAKKEAHQELTLAVSQSLSGAPPEDEEPEMAERQVACAAST